MLHRYVIDEVLASKVAAKGGATVHYHKTMDEAVEAARRCTSGTGVAVLMPATTMAQLRDICTAGELMPQKSTYSWSPSEWCFLAIPLSNYHISSSSQLSLENLHPE